MKAIGNIYWLFTASYMAFTTSITAQQDIYLSNASFEGQPDDATIPIGWFACTPTTTPDILPGPWGVYQEATEGDTYMGLITRGDGTFESIGQRLPKAIKAKECYKFSLDLAHSDTYAGYNKPVKLRIWVGQQKCDRGQLIAETDFIDHLDFRTYRFQFNAKKDGYYIIIEAYYKDGRFSHQGNILIDNFSAIRLCNRA